MIRFLQSGNKAAKYLLGGLLTILAVSMVAYLIPGFMSGSSITQPGVIASVGGHEISTQEVTKIAETMMRQAGRGQRNVEGMRPFFIQRAIPQLITQAELRYESERMGLSVSDQELRDELHSGPYAEAFFPGGKWIGQDKYEEMLREANTTVDDFESQVRFQLLANKLMSAVTAGITVSPAEIEKAFKDQNTKVKFDYAVLDVDELQKQIKPADAELKAYYDANKTRYQNSIPEKREVSYFLLNEQQVASKITVTPTDLDRYYRQHDEEFRTPDRVRVRHILIKSPGPGPDGKVDQKAVDAARAKAADILKQVKAGGDFAELAKKNSDDPGSKEKGGELGWIVKGQTVPEFEQASFAMNPGQISDLVQSSFGFHIIQTEEKETAHKKSLAEVKDSIESILKQQNTATLMENTVKAAETAATKQGMDKAAIQYGTQAINTNPISRTDKLAGVGDAPELMSEIFSVDPKDGVRAARTPTGYAVYQVVKIIPPSTPTFEAIKDRVTNDFKSERANTLLNQKTIELSDRARSAHDLRKAAKELNATVKSSELVGRGSQVPDIGSMAGGANVAFTMKPGEISGPVNLGRKGVVLAITERQEPPLTGDDFAKAKDNLYEELVREKGQEAQRLFLDNLDDRLKKEGKVKVNEKVAEGLLRGGRG